MKGKTRIYWPPGWWNVKSKEIICACLAFVRTRASRCESCGGDICESSVSFRATTAFVLGSWDLKIVEKRPER